MSPAESLAADREPRRLATDAPSPLRACRTRLSLSLSRVADAVGVSVGYLSGIELGNNLPSLTVARRLARFYGVPIDELWPDPDAGTATEQGRATA